MRLDRVQGVGAGASCLFKVGYLFGLWETGGSLKLIRIRDVDSCCRHMDSQMHLITWFEVLLFHKVSMNQVSALSRVLKSFSPTGR